MIDPKILSKKVLILDDMSTIRDALIAALKSLGFTNIAQAVDGKQGFEKANECAGSAPFELVFSDINMPNCNGIEFLRQFRGIAAYKAIPVIMVTSENELHTILEAVEAGASSYVLKPFTPKTIEAKIIEVFNKKSAGQK